WSVERSRAIEEQLDFRHQARTIPKDWVGAVTDVAFDDPRASRVWFMNRYSRATRRGYGVSVTELDAQHRPASQILAAQAWLVANGSGWEFRDGRQISFSPDSGEAMTNAPFREKFVPAYRDDPRLMLLTDRKPGDLSFFELRRLIRYFAVQNPTRSVPYAVQYYSIIAQALAPLIVIAIAIPFSIAGVRTNPVVGVCKSIGLFFLYYVLSTAAGTLATKGWVDPQFAAWLPNLGIAALAVWFFARIW
ncbi:MAG: LptF/LptG family permease, partial [Opitutaceae bacterium]